MAQRASYSRSPLRRAASAEANAGRTDSGLSQTVHARYSYRYDEIIWGAKFAQAFEIDGNGDMRLEVDRVSDIVKGLSLNP